MFTFLQGLIQQFVFVVACLAPCFGRLDGAVFASPAFGIVVWWHVWHPVLVDWMVRFSIHLSLVSLFVACLALCFVFVSHATPERIGFLLWAWAHLGTGPLGLCPFGCRPSGPDPIWAWAHWVWAHLGTGPLGLCLFGCRPSGPDPIGPEPSCSKTLFLKNLVLKKPCF